MTVRVREGFKKIEKLLEILIKGCVIFHQGFLPINALEDNEKILYFIFFIKPSLSSKQDFTIQIIEIKLR